MDNDGVATTPGVPVIQTTPRSVRGGHRRRMPDPFCSPIARVSPVQHGSPDGIGMTPLTCSSPVHGERMSPLLFASPSPSNKKLVGVSSNARNNIYMKTLMNSPYHKSYTPAPATPSSLSSGPVRTPLRHPSEQCASPMGTAVPMYTPQGSNPPLSAKKFITPKNVITNPFEVGIDNLHLPAYMSPGFFTVASTPASEKKTFRWSIEHLAELNPADIDEMPHQQANPVVPDKETEERAQRAIEQFFANDLIVPSPWSDPRKSKKKNVLPITPASQGVGGGRAMELLTELQGSIQKSLPPTTGMEDVGCQTVLSLPMDFDLQQVLGAYMTQEGSEDGNQQEMLSTSSLRRKLFFQGDTSSLAPSPVKGVSDGRVPEPMSPMFTNAAWDHTTPLKNTPAFSSSPIRSAGTTPQHRRCSSDPEFLASPELSPIVHGNMQKPMRRSRSSGVFIRRSACSDDDDDNDLPEGHQSTVSPIPFEGYGMSPEPEEGAEDFCPKFVDSLGFSPICPPKTPIRKILRRSHEESYIQDGAYTSDEETNSITPSNRMLQQATGSQRGSSTFSIHDALVSSTQITPQPKGSGSSPRSRSSGDLEQHDNPELGTRLRYQDVRLTSSLCETRDFSNSDMDHPDETYLRTSLSNQDTGYQTASLQSTNQESMSLHTNLTNQFSSLPFNLTNQDSAPSNTSHLLANLQKHSFSNVSQQFSSTARSDDDFDLKTDQANTSISKKLFPEQDLFSPNFNFLQDGVANENTPKNVISPRMHFDDSALPDEADDGFDSGFGKMDVDYKLVGDGLDPPSSEDVVSRAKHMLALANDLYPQDFGLDPVSKTISSRIKPDISGNLQKHGRPKPQTGSELAYSILQRAGEDLIKLSTLTSFKTSELTPEGLHES